MYGGEGGCSLTFSAGIHDNISENFGTMRRSLCKVQRDDSLKLNNEKELVNFNL